MWLILDDDNDGTNPCLISLVAYADNAILHTTSHDQLQSMLTDRLNVLGDVNWTLSPDSMYYGCITSAQPHTPIMANGAAVKPMEPHDTCVLIGVNYQMDAGTSMMVQHRLNRCSN